MSRIHVTAEFDSNQNVKEFDVIHELLDDTMHNRSDQYTNAGLDHKAGYQDWYWKGTWVKNQSVTMMGHLYHNQQGWFYAETQWANGDFLGHLGSSTVHVTSMKDINPEDPHLSDDVV